METQRGLEDLARLYWFPLYAYVRRQGSRPQEAEDLTQSFFARLLEKDYLADVHPSKGKFRSFLLAALKHFLSNERDKALSQKRGGQVRTFPLDTDGAEGRYASAAVDDMTPERLFERRWALAVLDEVMQRLRRDYAERGQEPIFEALRCCLAGESDAPRHAQIAAKLGMSQNAVKVAAHRLRQRYRDLLHDEVAQTLCADGDSIDDDSINQEIRHLLACL